MSHFTTIKTKITHKDYLKKALTDLGYSYQEGNVKIGGYSGNTAAEIKIAAGNSGYDIGFRLNNQVYDVVADWWGIRNINREQFLQSINQRYAYHAAKDKLEEQGFSLVTEEVQQEGRIHLVLRRTV